MCGIHIEGNKMKWSTFLCATLYICPVLIQPHLQWFSLNSFTQVCKLNKEYYIMAYWKYQTSIYMLP